MYNVALITSGLPVERGLGSSIFSGANDGCSIPDDVGYFLLVIIQPRAMFAYLDLGSVGKKVTTSSTDCQLWMDRGIAHTFGFNHEEANSLFPDGPQL